MPVQLRVYEIESGRVRQFAEEWRTLVAPLRRRFGFTIRGAWLSEAEDTFGWLVEHDDDFAAADAAYYASAERAAFDPDPARLIAHVLVQTIVEPLR